ncbi:MAG: glutathione peroxidase [Bacteroidales bacterium]
MNKLILILLPVLFAIACNSQNNKINNAMKENIYQFIVEDINGKPFDFSTLKGKKIMVVNTASKCGFTPQYADLEKLYQTYKDSDFIIVGFPSNNFMWQEPGTNSEISSFCQLNYGVTFPMMAKIQVRGMNKHQIYRFLTDKSRNGISDKGVKWNFQKFLIDREGHLSKVIPSSTSPLDAEIIKWIESE